MCDWGGRAARIGRMQLFSRKLEVNSSIQIQCVRATRAFCADDLMACGGNCLWVDGRGVGVGGGDQ